jgi:TRAP-type mannitol/chloroaromatic compound transport system substrate-binding protein
MFEPDILRRSFVEQNQDGGLPEVMSEIFATWVDTVVESVTENKINTQSDNILDLISDLEAVIDENFTEEEKKEIIKIIESDVMKKFLNTGSVYEKIFDSKKDMQSKIMSTIYSEENDRKFRSRVSDKFPGIELDPDGHGFDI